MDRNREPNYTAASTAIFGLAFIAIGVFALSSHVMGWFPVVFVVFGLATAIMAALMWQKRRR